MHAAQGAKRSALVPRKLARRPCLACGYSAARGQPLDKEGRVIGYAFRLTGPVAVWCRSYDSVMCSKEDEPWAQEERKNFEKTRCEWH